MRTKAALLSLFLVSAILFTGCGQRRVAPFAPRMPDITEHHALNSDDSCLDCHDLKTLPGHKISDTCFDCHRIIPGR